MLRAIKRGLGTLAGGALVAGTLAIGVAAPASAADDLQLSNDGVHWASTLSSDVFAKSQTLVPGSTVEGTFFVRNATASAAWIRVGVSELTVTSEDLALSLNMSAVGTNSDSASGSTSSLSGDDIVCSDVLVRSTPVPPGGFIRVDASLTMRPSVSGTTAQAEAARLAFIAEISDTDLNAIELPLCEGTTTIDPSLRPGSGGGGTGGSGGSGSGGTSPTTGGAANGTNGANAPGVLTASGIVTALAAINGGSLDIGGVSRPYEVMDADLPYNSVHWYEEYAILVLIGAALTGAIARFTAQRRWVNHRHPKLETS